ncbi:MAG TPA: galactose oxidase early set domain-containing protein [Actinomycetota bacterium]|nr:galactose oxidase early set domain-containing protein [Actinomycetota bacterium]
MRRGRRLGALALVIGLVAVPAGAPQADDGAPGSWGSPFAEDPRFAERPPQTPEESTVIPAAASAAVLPDGRVLYWNGLQGSETGTYPQAVDISRVTTPSDSRVLDLSDPFEPEWTVPAVPHGGRDDMFCADVRILSDGRVIVVGGTRWGYDPLDTKESAPQLVDAFESGTGTPAPRGVSEVYGSNATRFFDPVGNGWDAPAASNMNYGRWYPTLLTLPTGDMFVASGVEQLITNERGLNVHETEILDLSTGTWRETGPNGSTSLPLFPRLHLLPSGKVFYTGTAQMWSPAGQAVDQALWAVQKAYDPLDPDSTWQVTGIGAFGPRSGVFSVMLPLTPENGYSAARFLIGGGTLGVTPGSYVANNLTEIVTVRETDAGTQSTSEIAAPLNNARWYSSGVLLPDGSVVAVSGGDRDEVIMPQTESAVRQAELWDPATQTWAPLASARRERTYHNTAVLLADGSVLVGGHAPLNSFYGPTGAASPGVVSNNLKDPSFEILRPPYLDRGPRPAITGVQSGVAWGSTFDLGVESGDGVGKVVLVRLPSTTHVTDADMRAVELSFTQGDGGALEVTAPPTSTVAPPGFYYLFALSEEGVPSKARIVKVGPETDPTPTSDPMPGA